MRPHARRFSTYIKATTDGLTITNHPAKRIRQQQVTCNNKNLAMESKIVKVMALVVFIGLVASLFNCVEATYRKPPFNGSIFGKRGTSQEYDTAGKALSAMCEIASEACQAWFPPQDK